MTNIYASEDNLTLVRQAIADLVQGKRQVRVSYTMPDGYKQEIEYTDVSLSELRQLETEMHQSLYPVPVMESIHVEVLF